MSPALHAGRLRAGAGRVLASAGRAREGQRRTVYKLCSLALQYPGEELLPLRPQAAREAAALGRSAPALARFMEWWQAEPPLPMQQHYVETFDMEKRCSLYLTYFSEGERRDRGLALLRLRKLYRAAGLPMACGELPDFLPVMLEFAAAAPAEYAETPLREHHAALSLLHSALRERATPYADVLDAVCAALGEPSAVQRAKAALLAEQGPPTELVGLEPGEASARMAPPMAMPPQEARG